MSFYALPVEEVRAGDVLHISGKSRDGVHSTKTAVTGVRVWGESVEVFTKLFKYANGVSMPLRYGMGATVGVDRH